MCGQKKGIEHKHICIKADKTHVSRISGRLRQGTECIILDKLDKYVINGGRALKGTVTVSGAKNSAVAIIPAVVLCDESCIIENLPKIRDVKIILNILKSMGAKVSNLSGDCSRVKIDPRGITSSKVTCEDLVGKMRASYYLLGALLGKFGSAEVPPPGGCKFCERPIDLHIKGPAAERPSRSNTQRIGRPGPSAATPAEPLLPLCSAGQGVRPVPVPGPPWIGCPDVHRLKGAFLPPV